MKKSFLFITILLLLIKLPSIAQIQDPVKWSFSSKAGSAEGEVILVLKAQIDSHWHIYSQFIEEGGPVPTSFTFTPSDDYELVGKVKEISKVIKGFDQTFGMDIAWFDSEAIFEQKIKLKKEFSSVSGGLVYMVCDDAQCLPPADVDFTIPVKTVLPKDTKAESPEKKSEVHAQSAVQPKINQEAKETLGVAETNEMDAVGMEGSDPPVEKQEGALDNLDQDGENFKEAGIVDDSISDRAEEKNEMKSLWTILIAGFLGGLAALLMPCIFPMLPLTVSYFTKSNDKGSAVGKALIYGASIVVIYVLLGLAITVVFGADALNALSTNGVFNFFFFLLLVVFAASFFGAFELTLPHSWGNKLDQKSDKSGLAGLFFMAATLAIVSFSCTGPIIGTLLVQAASMGEYLGPAVGMLGFSVALAAPFALFALFPSWLQSLPKSGGWLNSVKVVLGFLELALALKFLSNVDLAYHWDWFDREVFLVLWISIFGLLGMYLLGKIRFAHDSPVEYVSTPRIFLGIIVVAFTIYMIPGLWGAPLKSISAFLPPQHTQDFDLYTPTVGGIPVGQAHSGTSGPQRKYAGLFHAPLNLDPFFDYEEGMEYARQVGKPVLIDFTGHACVNCRKMEASIWPDPQVLKLIRDEYV
ncbi:protein-disulfide reductase DsbD family protein, partial [Belliella marina]